MERYGDCKFCKGTGNSPELPGADCFICAGSGYSGDPDERRALAAVLCFVLGCGNGVVAKPCDRLEQNETAQRCGLTLARVPGGWAVLDGELATLGMGTPVAAAPKTVYGCSVVTFLDATAYTAWDGSSRGWTCTFTVQKDGSLSDERRVDPWCYPTPAACKEAA